MEWSFVYLCVIIICGYAKQISGHVPMNVYEWAEPNSPVRVINWDKTTRVSTTERVNELRDVLSAQETPIDAYIIPTADAHNSQYIAPSDARREWISGFTGSNGIAVVTATEALLWTDGRYFTQFDIEVDNTVWTLMRQGTDDTIQGWLSSNLGPNSVVGIDPTTYTRTAWTTLETALTAANVTIQPTLVNLVDVARENLNDSAPPRPNNPIAPLALEFTGKRSDAKISELISQINQRGASALVLTALDDVAYTLNLRGKDIPYNPVFFAYLIIKPTTENNVVLFWSDGILSSAVTDHLSSEGVTVEGRPYSDVFEYLENLALELPEGSTIWLSQDGSEAIHLAAAGGYGSGLNINTVSTVSPVALMKCIKNEVELQGFRRVHEKDGIAVVRFLHWLHERVDADIETTEMDASDELERLRSLELYFEGPSFATIAGAGENGAIIHYKPSRDVPERTITKDDVFLVDSGGQYWDGTTDITRTRHMNYTPTNWQKMTFTRVLKGQINLGTAVFPRGTRGNTLDILARKALWDAGLDYAHGTGHGVGHYLNVHEGPSGIGSGVIATDPGIVPGMIFSNEPGYYELDEFGIRHEDLVEVIEINSEADHIYADINVGDFGGRGAVGFYTISLVPHQTACIDVTLLTDHELKYINDYHARVLNTLGPILRERGLEEELKFLERECTPLVREGNFALRIGFSPILIGISILILWIQNWR